MKPKRYFVGEDHDQPGRYNQGKAHHIARDLVLEERPLEKHSLGKIARDTKKKATKAKGLTK